MAIDFYNIPLKDHLGRKTSLLKYKNNVLLICNMATKCGLAKENLIGLSDLAYRFKHKNFKVLIFPTIKIFPDDNSNIKLSNFIDEYSTDLILFDVIEANGQYKHDLYKYLSDTYEIKEMDRLIRYNFTKFLVDRKGKVRMKYLSSQCINDDHLEVLKEVLDEVSDSKSGM